ncbi:MAG: D-aminoacylase domain protein, partial [Gemmatimonadetes bacterium]|nr:D-aminoacylase domain protein [Gemmatimonadota bacterium]
MNLRPLLLLTGALALPVAVAAQGQGERYDLLITGGTILDGTGAPGFAGDVAVRGDRIVRISRSPLPRAQATRVIEATGLVVSPGFIDLHTHLEPLPEWPDAESHVRQGVTLAIGGPDGGGPWPFGAYLRHLDSLPLGMNVGFLAGHNTIRAAVMGMAGRDPTPAELERMKAMVRQSMAEGAFGMSTGLFYLPGTFSKLDEVVALSK